MATLIPLHALFSRGRANEHPVCHIGERFIEWHEFSASVASHAVMWKARPEIRWLLSSDDPRAFAINLFALLHAGKQVVIPPNTQPGTLTQLSGTFDAVATDHIQDIDSLPGPLATLAPNNAVIELYTSGSSGHPKKVSKTLAQFEAEIATLESQWGNEIDQTTIVATVPHHHIYGLLFRLLWPMSAGRPFDAVTCTYPDTLNERLTLLKNTTLVSSPAQLSRLPTLLPLDRLVAKPRIIFSSGGPLPAATASEFHHQLGSAPTEIFGSTETGGIAWRRQNKDDAWSTFPGIVITCNNNGIPLLTSPFLVDNSPRQMDDAVDVLQDGRFLLRERLDRIVKIEEKRLSLPEMEAQLVSHPWAIAAAALPIKGRRHIIGAAIVLNAEGKEAMNMLGRRETIRHLRAHLAKTFESVLLPRIWRFPEQLPTNERGKVSNADISKLFLQTRTNGASLPEVISIHRDVGNSQKITLDLHIPKELPHFEGHFPDFPILPGIVQIDWAVRYARIYLNLEGNFSALENIKFQAIVLPESKLKLNLNWNKNSSRLEFSFATSQRIHSDGRITFSGVA
jgi:acyl-CoA synthetase (AMP-forming)/AMP-acid ligase II/3-hydroxymyristoyl/3-hydroxydecanoyl-(acyl carrier protein) dehydratase